MLVENAQMSSLVRAGGGKWVFMKWDTSARPEGFLLRGGGEADPCCRRLYVGFNSFKKLKPGDPWTSGAPDADLFGRAGCWERWLGWRWSRSPRCSPWAEQLIPKPLAELIALSCVP